MKGRQRGLQAQETGVYAVAIQLKVGGGLRLVRVKPDGRMTLRTKYHIKWHNAPLAEKLLHRMRFLGWNAWVVLPGQFPVEDERSLLSRLLGRIRH